MDELIPIVAMALTLGPLAVLVLSYTPLGKALTDRLRGSGRPVDEQILALKAELRHELIEEQAAQLEELHERLDFTERLLSDTRRSRDAAGRVVTPV